MSGFASKRNFSPFVFTKNNNRSPERIYKGLESQSKYLYENAFAFYGRLSPDGFLLELDGKIFAENESTIEPELLVGHKFSDTVFWHSAPYIAEKLQHAISEAGRGKMTVAELDFRITAQDVHTVEMRFIPEMNASAREEDTVEVKEIHFCAYDITHRVREVDFYKERSEQFLYAAENAEIGLWFWDFSKNEIFSTPKCNEFFGLPPHEIITLDYFIDAVHPEDRERVAEELQKSQAEGDVYNSEFRIISADGSIQWINVRGKTFLDKNNQPQSMMGIARRITDRKLADDELKRIYELEKKARDEAEEANRAKDYFLAIVSHELRSPLNSILGWAKILLTKNVDEPTRKNALETIERSAKSQAKLIEDLVDMARVASGKLRLELRSVNLFDIVNAAFNQQKPLAEAKHVDLEFNYDSNSAEVFADAIRLQQVFTNLLNNALKFTPEGGNVSIDMKTDSNKVEVNIADSGQGIAPEFLPNIFRQFAQADEKSTTGKSGLGLGLSIAKTLVEKHNGFISARSEGVGQGAVFTVAFPLHTPVTAAAAADSPAAEQISEKTAARQNSASELKLKNINILLVEDDQDSRDVLALYLEQCGARIQGAESALEAMKYLQQENGHGKFDIIVSDLAMPVEDGYTFMTRVRQLPKEQGGKLPALALSAFTTAENKQRAFAAGFQSYHTKPFEPDLLIKEIISLVKNK